MKEKIDRIMEQIKKICDEADEATVLEYMEYDEDYSPPDWRWILDRIKEVLEKEFGGK